MKIMTTLRSTAQLPGLVTVLPLLLRGALLGFTRTQRTSIRLSNSLPPAKLFPLSLVCSRRLHSVSSSLHMSSSASSPAANSSTTSVILPHGETSGTRGLDVLEWLVTGIQQRSCHAAAADDAMNTTISSSKAQVIKELEQALGSPLDTQPQTSPQNSLVIVISGPSGVGKDAVIKKLQEVRQEIHFVVTATTRPRRPNEVDGVDYYFVTKPEFQDLIARNELLEHAVVYGDYKGIPKKQVRECMSTGQDVLLRLDIQGAATVRKILGQEAVFIFMVAESELALVERLVERKTESIDKLVIRVATAREEVKHMRDFDYVVVNADGQLERTVSQLCSIIDAEKARVHQRHAQF